MYTSTKLFINNVLNILCNTLLQEDQKYLFGLMLELYYAKNDSGIITTTLATALALAKLQADAFLHAEGLCHSGQELPISLSQARAP